MRDEQREEHERQRQVVEVLRIRKLKPPIAASVTPRIPLGPPTSGASHGLRTSTTTISPSPRVTRAR